MDAVQLKAAGLGEELVRLAIGIEAASDIIDDLAQALRASQRAEPCVSSSTAAEASPAPAAREFDRAQPLIVFLHGAGLDHSGLGAAGALVRASRLGGAGA